MNNLLDMLTIEKEINKNVLNNANRYEAIGKILRTTEEYYGCKRLYDFFVCEIAHHIHSVGINNSEAAIIYFDLLLRNGILSVTNKNDYHLFKYEKEFLPELLGARAISGASVCRHMSALTADVLNIEHYASWLNVRYIESPEELEKENPYLHAVVGLIGKNGKIIYDPTSSSFASEPQNKEYTLKTGSRIAETFISFTSLTEVGDLILLNPQQCLVNTEYEKELINVWYTPFEEVILNDYLNLVKQTTKLYRDTLNEIQYLKKNARDIIEEIVDLEQRLQPHGDTPILKWQLHQ